MIVSNKEAEEVEQSRLTTKVGWRWRYAQIIELATRLAMPTAAELHHSWPFLSLSLPGPKTGFTPPPQTLPSGNIRKQPTGLLQPVP